MLRYLKTLPGHQNPVYTLVENSETSFFYSAGNDKGIVEWSVPDLAFHKVKFPVQSTVYCLHIYENLLFAGERSGAFNIFDLREEKLIKRINGHEKAIFDIKTIKAKQELLTTGEDGTVAVWSLNDFKELYRFEACSSTLRCIAVHPDEQEIALGCKDHLIKIYNLSDFSFKQSLAGHDHPVTALAYHPDGAYLISGGRDAQLKIWDLPSYELKQNIPAHLFAVYSILFHPVLPCFATGSQDKGIKLWDSRDFRLLKILSLEKTGMGHRHSINKLCWLANGRFLASTGDDRQIIIWEFS